MPALTDIPAAPAPKAVAHSLGLRLSASLLATLLVLVAMAAAAAPKAELWERWTAHDAASTATIDHSAWTRLLETYVRSHPDGVNRFLYARVTVEDKRRLDDYVEYLAAIPISTYNRDEQRAFWINLYNALTVELILEHYPVESITDIDLSPDWFAFGPWDKKLIRVESEALSLNDVEHRILRPIWRDPRLHYAVNCASIGCPNLRKEAFTAANADELLERAAREYVNHDRGAQLIDGQLVVSSIYEWFKEDFGNRDAGVIQHLLEYARPELASALRGVRRIGGHAYDWALNAPPAESE